MMNIKDTFTKHFHKTNCIIKEAVLTAGGWHTEIVNPEIVAIPQTFCYVWDQSTQYLWMCSVDREMFAEISLESSKEKPDQHKLYCQSLGELIRVAANGLNTYGNWKESIGLMMAKYAGITKTWKLAHGMVTGGNFIVCRYENKKSGLISVRPLYLADTDNLPVPADVILDLLQDVYEMDKQNHPDWFG